MISLLVEITLLGSLEILSSSVFHSCPVGKLIMNGFWFRKMYTLYFGLHHHHPSGLHNFLLQLAVVADRVEVQTLGVELVVVCIPQCHV